MTPCCRNFLPPNWHPWHQTLWQLALICRWFRQACMEKSAGTSVAGLQDSRFGYFKNRQGRLSGLVTVGKRPGCSEPLTPLEVAASPALRGKGASHGRTYGFTFYETVASTRANSFKLPLSYSRNIRLFKGPLLSTHSLQNR
ncbi:hypothetical protein AVEN_85841-1 [Araneus ventricosus]|uniref:Uncharacterized protein n=1 Tax=Araneus ventricosus TaxID=182803 RepID=A0A4Y2GW56_ARAVE|nr:hypothetical protein AVEN_85841-1 [Araneus ventricosus]